MAEVPDANFQEIVLILKQQERKKDPNKERQIVQKPPVRGLVEVPQISLEVMPEPVEKNRLKSKGRKIAIGLIISLSALMFGYSIKQITSIKIEVLV